MWRTDVRSGAASSLARQAHQTSPISRPSSSTATALLRWRDFVAALCLDSEPRPEASPAPRLSAGTGAD